MGAGRRLVGSLAAAAALLVCAPGASAVVYCVNDPTCVGTVQPNLETALATAAGTTTVADEIHLGPGVYTDPTGSAYFYNNVGANPANDITIQGAGAGLTTLTQTQTGFEVLYFVGGNTEDRIVKNLSVTMPTGSAFAGILEPTLVQQVRVQGAGAINGDGIVMTSGTISGTEVVLPKSGTNTGILLDGQAVTISDSRITANTGIGGPAGNATYARLRIDAGVYGVNVLAGGATFVEDLQVTTTGSGVRFESISALGVTASHLTVVGVTSGVGVAIVSSAGGAATLNLRNSVVSNFLYPLSRSGNGTNANLTVTDSVLPLIGHIDSGPGLLTTAAGNNADTDLPLLVNDGSGDLFPRFDSPAIDRGNPAYTASPTDVTGAARTVDGNGDGNARPDAGAIEYRRQAPTARVFPGSALSSGLPAAFSASGSTDPDPGDTLTHAWAFSDGGTAAGQDVTHTFANAGRVDVGLVSRDPTGLTSSTTFVGNVTDGIIPVISSASMQRVRFRRGAGPTARITRARALPPRGSAFRFRLSERATVRIALFRRVTGRRVGRSCLPATRARRLRPRCLRYGFAGTLLRRNLAPGSRSVTFTGRLGRSPLPAGFYKAVLTAVDASNNRSAARNLYFTIVAG